MLLTPVTANITRLLDTFEEKQNWEDTSNDLLKQELLFKVTYFDK